MIATKNPVTLINSPHSNVNYLYTFQQEKWNAICLSHIGHAQEGVLTQTLRDSMIYQKHGINQLVWYQEFATIDETIVFEKKIKGKSRAYKIQLIEEKNQHRVDLAMNWFN